MESFPSPSDDVVIGEDNVFEISDFTVVTEFEVLVLTLENAIQEMKSEADSVTLLDLELSSSPSIAASRKFDYKHYSFQIDYFKQNKNGVPKFDDDFREKHDYLCDAALALTNAANDFFEDLYISRQFGVVTDFFLICIIGKNNYMSENGVNMLQSAANVASLNTDCEIPIFFQFSHGAAVGLLQNRNFLTNFEGAVLNSFLSKHKYLDGVMEMFKQKFNSPVGSSQKIRVSLEHEFCKELGSAALGECSSDLSSAESDPTLMSESRRFRGCQHIYPFQPVDSSLLRQLHLSAVWADLDEHYLAETDNFSNIDPQTAHRWKCSVQFDDEFSYEQSYLFTRLFELTEEEFSERTIKSQIPETTNTSPSLGKAVFGEHINKPAIRNIDIVGIVSTASYKTNFAECVSFITSEETITEDEHLTTEQHQLMHKLALAKSAPANSLTRRLALCLVTKIDGNFVGFCRLWIKFLEILRHHWEFNLDLPNFSDDERPDISRCLIHQKLQMIQYCISVKKRKYREMEANELNIGNIGSSIAAKDEVSRAINTEDEFFDANESFEETEEEVKPDVIPRGRNYPLESNECLKNYPDERIYVPVTQDQGPMTEDQIEKRESYLINLEDADQRTRAQSELLLSDMQAFKAANPRCVLEDFLRWHSPRDLSDEGELSERMNLPGNLWQETWNSAKAVPSAQQPRLFNETREVEQIFQYFSNLHVKELVKLLLPVVSLQMAEILVKAAKDCWELVKPDLEKLCNEVNLATKTEDLDAYFDVGHSLRFLEEMIMKHASITDLILEQAKNMQMTEDLELSLLNSFVSQLCKSSTSVADELCMTSPASSCEVHDAPYGPIFGVLSSFIAQIEEDGEREWPGPVRKQTILRKLTPHPGNGSRLMPQRMYTSYREGEFIFCGSFTSDLTFI